MNKVFSLIGIILILAIVSCKEETEEAVDMGYDYFPTEIGFYQIYEVDSIVFDDYNDKVDTFKYQVKMLVEEQLANDDNLTRFRWRKSVKSDTSSWQFSNNYTIDFSDFNLQTVVEDYRYMNLVFPVAVGNSWNYNALNSLDSLSSLYTDIDFDKTVLGEVYTNCVEVTYQDEVNLIQEFVHIQIYSRNVGMIFRKDVYKEEQSDVKGYNLEYKLMEYGKE